MDCTVDSMLTTTPFFSPRDGCVPMPTTSSSPPAPSSPTMALTFDVPMSRPTIRLRSDRLGIVVTSPAAPPERETIAVAKVDVGQLAGPRVDDGRRGAQEALHALLRQLAAEPQLDAVAELHAPRAARI